MKNKVILFTSVLILLFTATACNKDNDDESMYVKKQAHTLEKLYNLVLIQPMVFFILRKHLLTIYG